VKREIRQPTKKEWAEITGRRPVLRRIPPPGLKADGSGPVRSDALGPGRRGKARAEELSGGGA
jgi:hypothetical protein